MAVILSCFGGSDPKDLQDLFRGVDICRMTDLQHAYDTRRIINGKSIDGRLKFYTDHVEFMPNAAALPSVAFGLGGQVSSMAERGEKFGFEAPYTALRGALRTDPGFTLGFSDGQQYVFNFPGLMGIAPVLVAIAQGTGRTASLDDTGVVFAGAPSVTGAVSLANVKKPRKVSELVATGFLCIVGVAIIGSRIFGSSDDSDPYAAHKVSVASSVVHSSTMI
jgi:hypothetical protein